MREVLAGKAGKYVRFDEGRQQRFLRELEAGGVIGHACAAVGVHRDTVRQARERDEDFDRECRAAIDCAIDKVESVALRLATEGSPVVGRVAKDQDGVVMAIADDGSKRPLMEHDTGLIKFLLQRRRPELYSERVQVDANVNHGVLAVPTTAQDSTAWAAEVARVERGEGQGDE